MPERQHGVARLRQAKINHKRPPVAVHENVGGFQITMQNPPAMRALHCCTHLSEEVRTLPCR